LSEKLNFVKMPPKKKSCIGKNTLKSRKVKEKREKETPYTREVRRESDRLKRREIRANECSDVHSIRIEAARLRQRVLRTRETTNDRAIRL